MSRIKEKGNNTFEWKIHINDIADSQWSGLFDECKYEIEYDHILCSSPEKNLYQFYLWPSDDLACPISYTFSILDRAGHAFHTSKGKVLNAEVDEERLLTIIDVSYLNAYNLTESGTFTVRFSLYHELETQEGSHPYKEENIDDEADDVQDSAHYQASAGNHCASSPDKDPGRSILDSYVEPIYARKGPVTPPGIPPDSDEEASNVADSRTDTNPLLTKDSSTNTDEDINLLETLSNNFSTFYDSKMDTDCVLRVSDIQFHVHRAILSARSSVFAAMFHHDTAENHSGEVDILDIKATTLDAVLYYVYSGKIKGLTTNTAASIYTAADKYDLCELRSKCFEFLKSNLTLDNLCEVVLLAHIHGEMELEERVVSFIEENLDEVLESNTWEQFLKDETLLASKLLTSACKVSKKKLRNMTSK